jgi:PAS domain S-box-containing protein
MNRDGDAIRVLHVDDDEGIRELTREYLGRENDRLVVEQATGTADALERLDDAVDCVVADYEMTDGDGIELLEAVRDEYPDLPYVLYTGKGSEEIASEAISAGVTDYLQKSPGSGQYAVLANRIVNAVEAYRSERLLERRTRRLERLIGNLPGMVYRCRNEPGWPMETVEGEVEALSGYDADAIERGEVLWGEDVLHPEDRDWVWEHVQDSIDEDGTFEVSYRIRTSSGETRWMWERGRSVHDDGDLIALEGFITDVTERKRREQRLEETTARLAALFEQSPDMINVHDAEGTIDEPNARLCEKTGYSEDELVGMKVWEIDLSADPETVREVWAEMEPGESHRLESEYERADGSTFPVELHTRRLDDGEDAGTFVVISRDVTERRERERDLERFASVLSHDLRNPLNVAQGRLDLARAECDSEHLEQVGDAHERMNDLIDSLLDLARGGETTVDTVSLAATVEEAWANVDTGGATLESTVTAAIRADRSRLAQLFENLFRNSVTYGAADEISDVTVAVGPLPDGFYVADDGAGIPEAEREAVFEAGYSGDGGTGFGLSIVERVAEAHGWSVRLAPAEDGGARFEFTGVEEG